MALGTTPLARGAARNFAFPWRALLEALLVAGVVALLLPAFARLAASDAGRDDRFLPSVLRVAGLPGPVLPDLCRAYQSSAEAPLPARLCNDVAADAQPPMQSRLPRAVQLAQARATQAFLAPVQEAKARIADLRAEQRDGRGEVLALDNAIDAITADLRPYLARYGIDEDSTTGPRALACAVDAAQAASMQAPAAVSNGARDTLRANTVLLLGAALDGRPVTASLARTVALPPRAAMSPGCPDGDLADALGAAAALMADARAMQVADAKNEAMRALLRSAGWQWASWWALALVLVALARLDAPRGATVALALAAWAAMAWAWRAPFPFAGEHGLMLGRSGESLRSAPAPYVVGMLVVAACVLATAMLRRPKARASRFMVASPLALPAVALATGVGFVLLLDLSANGHYGNRFLALYHAGHLWLALATLSVVALLREPLGRAAAWTLSLVDGLASRIVRRIGAGIGGGLLLLVMLAITVVLATLLANLRQLTSELGRLWLIVGGAWFFFLRGAPMMEQVARGARPLASLVRYAWPLLFVVVLLVAAMLATRDMGPLLIAGYGAGAFLAACVAMWTFQRNGARAIAYGLAMIVFAAWIAVVTAALLRLGAIDEVTAGRLENAAAPLASANDHLALVTWFQRAAPPQGFGPGAVPWCGFGASRSCPGVPAQIQSDYTFTALVGMFGTAAAWALTLGTVAWLYALVRRHAQASRGEPRLMRAGARVMFDDQGFVSWVVVAWVALTLCQLAVTVAGNLAVIPLTGVTFPFVSFGMTSLVVNMAMLGLAVNVRARREHDDA